MMSNTYNNMYSIAPHPGIILKGELESRGLSQRELASALGKSAPIVNGILNGSKDITVEIAILLEVALKNSMTAQEWLRLQNEHDLDKKRMETAIKERTDAIKIWNYLRDHANMNALRRRLSFGSDFEANIKLIMSTLGIATLGELETKLRDSNAGFKKSEKVQTDSANLFSWSIIVKNASNKQHISASFNQDNMEEIIDKLNTVFYYNNSTIEQTKSILNEYGIKFITEEKRLDKVPVDGYSFWIGDNPTIVATQRMNRIDNFAFTIMHELGHIALHLKSNCNVDYIDLDSSIMQINKQEKQANKYAIRALWRGETPDRIFEQIINPYAASKTLSAIAKEYKMNPAIAVGQYRHFCHERHLVSNPYVLCHELIDSIN